MAVIARRVAALVGLFALATACGTPEASPPGAPGTKVVAASSWEAAFAKAAGAKDVQVVVPDSVTHIADYDPKPSDLAAVAAADLVLYAEFEGFAGKLKDAAGGKAELLKLNLDNSPEVVRAEVTRLATRLGTTTEANAWLAKFDSAITESATKLKGAWVDGKPPKVVAQAFVMYAAKLAGAEVLGSYGPQPVTPVQLSELAAKKPELVLDNAHMSTGTVLPGTATKQVRIINYPGADHDLLGVYRANTDEIVKALRG